MNMVSVGLHSNIIESQNATAALNGSCIYEMSLNCAAVQPLLGWSKIRIPPNNPAVTLYP